MQRFKMYTVREILLLRDGVILWKKHVNSQVFAQKYQQGETQTRKMLKWSTFRSSQAVIFKIQVGLNPCLSLCHLAGIHIVVVLFPFAGLELFI